MTPLRVVAGSEVEGDGHMGADGTGGKRAINPGL
jgi:hypothetical protein